MEERTGEPIKAGVTPTASLNGRRRSEKAEVLEKAYCLLLQIGVEGETQARLNEESLGHCYTGGLACRARVLFDILH